MPAILALMRRGLLILLTGLLLSVIIYPSAVVYPAATLPDQNDTRLLAYIIGQVQNNLIHGRPLYTGTFFAPYDNTLTYSDLFLTTAIITLPFRLFTNSPVIIFNLAYLIGSALTFTTAFYFFRHITQSTKRALLANLLFSLSGYHLIYLPHLQVYSLWAVFLALYFFRRFQDTNHVHDLQLFFAATFLQLADSLFPIYLIFFAVTIFFFHKPSQWRRLVLNCLPFLIASLALVYPYLKLTVTFPEAARPIRDAAHFSLGLEEIITTYNSYLLPVLLLLCLRTKTKTIPPILFWLLIFGLVLSFGPVVKLFGHSLKIFALPLPLPYAFFYYFLPGLQGLRTPSRFILLAAIAASAIIALRLPKNKPVLITILLTLLFWQAGLPHPGYVVDPTPPSVYQDVKKLPPDAIILELPILLWNQPGHEVESLRSLYSLDHGHRRLGGYSGFAPQKWIDLVQRLNAFGLTAAIKQEINTLGVTHLVENNRLLPLQYDHVDSANSPN